MAQTRIKGQKTMAEKSKTALTYDPNGRPMSTKTVTDFKFMHRDLKHTLAALAAASGRDTITMFDLSQWRIPTNGVTVWQVGGKNVETLEGVILHHHPARTYWSRRYGESQASPPDCFSQDGITGFGDPGGSCQQCTLGEFGGPCRQSYRLYVLPLDATLPVHFPVPPTSIAAIRDYLRTVAKEYDAFSYQVLTRFKLTRAENSQRQPISRLSCEVVEVLPDEVVEKIRDYAEQMRDSLMPPRPMLPPVTEAKALAGASAEKPLFESVDDDIPEPSMPGKTMSVNQPC